jgi:hypothetical protein
MINYLIHVVTIVLLGWRPELVACRTTARRVSLPNVKNIEAQKGSVTWMMFKKVGFNRCVFVPIW